MRIAYTTLAKRLTLNSVREESQLGSESAACPVAVVNPPDHVIYQATSGPILSQQRVREKRETFAAGRNNGGGPTAFNASDAGRSVGICAASCGAQLRFRGPTVGP